MSFSLCYHPCVPSHVLFTLAPASLCRRIMEERKGQENFQLIVITHDERFAQMIGQKQHADRYYRISKDDR